MVLLDENGYIASWNLGAARIKGYSADEILGSHFSLFYPEEDRQLGIPMKLLERAAIEGRSVHEGWRLRKNGQRFWGSVVLTALHDENGKVIGFSKLTRDLTEKRETEERLRQTASELARRNEDLRRSEERYHRMIAEVEDYAIILLDCKGNIQNWNKGAQHIKGYTEEEALKLNFRAFYLPEDRESGLPDRLLAEARANNKATHEGWRIRKDGSRFWGSVVITALHDHDGNVTGFSKVTRDLTQKKIFEDHILKQNRLLEEYAHAVSHDLQEPLRKIMVFSSILHEQTSDAALLKNIGKIENAARRMRELVRGILDYARLGEQDQATIPTDLNEILADVEADHELMLAEQHAAILRDPLPVVEAVPVQMHQLFTNLVGNALRHGGLGTEIRISAKPQKRSPGFITITVSDNGSGFDPQYADKIFDLFRRLPGDVQGTGIGLALCRRIVENHGGSITATGEPGKGANFNVILPLAKTDPGAGHH